MQAMVADGKSAGEKKRAGIKTTNIRNWKTAG